MNAVKSCQAKQYSDQMICSRCGLQWDVNDPDPPLCQKDKPAASPTKFLRTPFAPKTTNP